VNLRLRQETGNGTVLALLLIAVGLLASGAILVFVAATQAATRAGTAADLAALAAADTARGLREGDPCAVAQGLAERNGASVRSCVVENPGSTVRITVAVPARFSFAQLAIYEASASARAGPPPLGQR